MSQPSTAFRDDELRFLQEQHQKAVQAVAKTEQERLDAEKLIEQYEDEFRFCQEELNSLLQNVVRDEQENRTLKMQLSGLDDNIKQTTDQNRELRTSSKLVAFLSPSPH